MVYDNKLNRVSAELRFEIIKMSNRSQSAHLGGALSCVDILTTLYWDKLNIYPNDPWNKNRDRVIFSKGHAVSALYAALAKRGYFSESELLNYNTEGFHLTEHPSPRCAPGVEWGTGSLGHGLSVAIGMGIAAKIRNDNYKIYAIMSDGECQEGSVWEAAMYAPKRNLTNLTVIVDFNKWQATGKSTDIMQIEPLREKFESFGWRSTEIDGHDIKSIQEAIDLNNNKKPLAIIANTIKGKGVSFMEDDNNWHYRSPTNEEVQQAGIELGVL